MLPFNVGPRLVVSDEAGFAGTAAAFVLCGFHAKKSVDRETLRGYNGNQRTNRPTGLKSPAPTPRNEKENPHMTEETRNAINRISEGEPIECSTDAYRSEIREALVRFALACLDINDRVRMRTALAEVNRLDKKHYYEPSALAPDELA
jgi:hypothetical protein